ncbi:hypothetical protein BREVNS_0188 [Brevinematales bacterium NS]|nr:hypothetical protein BREVNS_0188 [Brevinematales bacterium NS]
MIGGVFLGGEDTQEGEEISPFFKENASISFYFNSLYDIFLRKGEV